jgi:hypothetical protein
MSDGPFYEIADEMQAQIELGATCYQKFTCLACQSRQTMDVPNVLYTTGRCQECDTITDLVVQGCGFMLIASKDPRMIEAVQKSIDDTQPRNRN